MDHRFEDRARRLAPAFGFLAGSCGRLHAGVAAIDYGARVVRQKRKGRSRIGPLRRRWERRAQPHEVLRVVQPEVLEILGLLRGILKAAEEDNVVLEVGHAVPAPSWWSWALGLDPLPLPRAGLQPPEVIVVVERPLLRARELPSEQVDSAGVSPSAPRMAAAREGTIRAGDLTPLALVDEIDMQVVEEADDPAVVVFAAK